MIILALFVAVFAFVNYVNNNETLVADDKYAFQVLASKGYVLETSNTQTKITKEEAIDSAYNAYGAVIDIPPEAKLQTKAYHVVQSYEDTTLGSTDAWMIVFEGGKYKEELTPNGNYAMAVFVNSETGETYRASGFDSNDAVLRKNVSKYN